MSAIPEDAYEVCLRLGTRLAHRAPARARTVLRGCLALRPSDPRVHAALRRCAEVKPR